jgi:hypothetical protein
MGRAFYIARKATDLVELALRGDLDSRAIAACESELRAQLMLVQPAGLQALVDLREVVSYTLDARDALVALQRFLGSKASSTAYVGDSAQQRGLSLWVSHMVEGQVVHCFARHADGMGWLKAEPRPVTGVRPLARARNDTPASSKKAIG